MVYHRLSLRLYIECIYSTTLANVESAFYGEKVNLWKKSEFNNMNYATFLVRLSE